MECRSVQLKIVAKSTQGIDRLILMDKGKNAFSQ